jgi:2-polyprenyl-3-methyl-5-hydroxy-6-metoxy-1,4-benzoquinol methylase
MGTEVPAVIVATAPLAVSSVIVGPSMVAVTSSSMRTGRRRVASIDVIRASAGSRASIAHTTRCTPCTSGTPNGLRRATAGSRWIGLRSPDQAAKASWSAAEKIRTAITTAHAIDPRFWDGITTGTVVDSAEKPRWRDTRREATGPGGVRSGATMTQMYRVPVDPSAPNNPHAFALQMIGGGHDVLEIGCATGHVTQRLVEQGNRVTGVELITEAAELARPLLEALHVVDLDLTPLSGVEHGTFDVILLGDVIEHFRDPQAVIADLLTLLRPDGRVVISVPHVGFIDVRLMLLEGQWAYQDDGLLDRTHLRWFTRDSLRALLAGCGLVATSVQRVRMGIGASLLPIHPELHGPEVLDFVRADPEWETYQFVVTAERAAGQPDALDGTAPSWPTKRPEHEELAAHCARLEAANEALRGEVDAWRRSRVVRVTAPVLRVVHSIGARLRRR